jgi:hypothetical protein
MRASTHYQEFTYLSRLEHESVGSGSSSDCGTTRKADCYLARGAAVELATTTGTLDS